MLLFTVYLIIVVVCHYVGILQSATSEHSLKNLTYIVKVGSPCAIW